MFNTIKSKILILTLSIVLILSTILTCFTVINYKKDKFLMIENCNFTITTLAEQINKEITSINNSLLSLATAGSMYYSENQNNNILNHFVLETFRNNNYSVGGGVWFLPYTVTPAQKMVFKFAYKNKKGETFLETHPYDYITQNWYQEITSKVTPNKVVWSTPYYETQGSETLMVTAGAGIYKKNGELTGISTVDWAVNSIVDTIVNKKPTPNSFALFADTTNDFVIVSTYGNSPSQLGNSLKEVSWYNENLVDKQELKYKGKTYISYVKTLDNGMVLIINVPKNELFFLITRYMIIMLILLILTSILIATMTFLILKNNINKPIEKLTEIANKIGQGNLDTEIKLEKPKEFADLASTFNKMTQDIKKYVFDLNKVTKEKEKFESELSIARTIQYSALPNDFYPNRSEFKIAATMETAKEVGGDYYDFFFINNNQLVFLIADVSGKGIPAALFMMTTKTLIENLAEQNYTPCELINHINNKICQNNEQGFFVTLFIAIINVNTGKITFVNCGHNPPLIKRNGGKFEYLKGNSNLVLGALPDIKYVPIESELYPGDTIFLYTDGITEANNNDVELYGEKRLQKCLNKQKLDFINLALENIKSDVNKFTQGAEQSDDRTMLIFQYRGIDLNKLVIPAKNEHFNELNEWLEKNYNDFEISQTNRNKLSLACEEIFTNIVNYAYQNDDGQAEIIFEVKNEEVILTFSDNGKPFNPLEKEDPDITLSAEERSIGGLGIYMVKNIMDEVQYEYIDGKNTLIIKKHL